MPHHKVPPPAPVSVPRVGARMNLPRGAHVPGWIMLALCWAAWLWSLTGGIDMVDWGISAQALREGHYEVLLLNMFAHAGLLHIGMNSAVLAGLSPITVMAMGGPAKGAGRYIAFYLLAGLAGALLYVALNPQGVIPAVGASGAISGLIGFISRLGPRGTVLPLFSAELGRRIWQFVKANLILIAIFTLPFLLLGGGGILIAWEGHLGGFLFGLATAGLFAARRPPR